MTGILPNYSFFLSAKQKIFLIEQLKKLLNPLPFCQQLRKGGFGKNPSSCIIAKFEDTGVDM
jgi:hypothetical protein